MYNIKVQKIKRSTRAYVQFCPPDMRELYSLRAKGRRKQIDLFDWLKQ
jgi:hypothetical protein